MRDGVTIVKMFHVTPTNRGNHGNVGTDHIGERADFTRMVHANFHHGPFMAGIEGKQGERDSDVVVEIAAGGEDLVAGPQDRCDHFFGAGFPGAAGNGNDTDGHDPAICGGQALEGGQRIFTRNPTALKAVRHTCGEHGDGTLGDGVVDELMAVEVLPGEGDEQVAWPEIAGIRADACDATVGGTGAQFPTTPTGGLVQRQWFHSAPPFSARQAAARSTSEKA